MSEHTWLADVQKWPQAVLLELVTETERLIVEARRCNRHWQLARFLVDRELLRLEVDRRNNGGAVLPF